MSTAKASLTVAGVDVDVVFKDIKNLHIGVYPPMGRVRVAAPERLDEAQVRLAVVRRLPWIKRQRELLQAAQRQSIREMVTGESHYIWGTRHRLKIVEDSVGAHIEMDGNQLVMYISDGMSVERRRSLLDRWHREQLRQAIPDVLAKWEPKVGVTVPKWSIRRMKTKWGSCNRESGHIWFNVELAKKNPESLEYIAIHEMTHLLERGHGDRFTDLMDKFLPDWRVRRDRLNEAPLGNERWVRS